MTELNRLIVEACGLANDHPCAREHLWEEEACRWCPRCDGSQPVYRCARCGDYDYGERGGVAWIECESSLECRDARERFAAQAALTGDLDYE